MRDFDAELRRAGLHRDQADRHRAELPSDEGLDALELQIGYKLPVDVRHFLRFHSGTHSSVVVDVPNRFLELGYAPREFMGVVRFERLHYYFGAAGDSVLDHVEDLGREAEELVAEFRRMVPLSEMVSFAFFCLDFRADPDDPPVVFLDCVSSLVDDATNELVVDDWVTFVAPNFEQFLHQCYANEERLFGDDFKFPNRPRAYRFADELVAWERGFDAYVSQWFPVRRDLPLRR